MTAALMGFDGRIIERFSASYARSANQKVITAAIEEATRKCFKGRNLTGIGVAASGMVNATTGQIISMILTPGLDGLEVRSMLSDQFNTTVLVDHHPRVLALGDRWFGLARHGQDFASVYTGEALGFGIVRQGQIVSGVDGAGGESGHTIVQLDGTQCECGNRGCWETVATLAWLRSEAQQLSLPDASLITSAQLVECANNNDSGARALLDRYARNLATGIANNEHVLASGTYIMHGDVCGGGDVMLKAIEDWVTRLSPKRGNPPKVLFAESPDDMSLLGGGGLVLSQAFSTSA
ncbi:ROK family protein [Arthrobacter alpinus]|nr:ROK family protein [Arthrobacter alpinus]